MKRKLIDYTDILKIEKDTENNIGLIILRDLCFLDNVKKQDTIIKCRGTEFTQYETLDEMKEAMAGKESVITDCYAFNELNQIVFAVSIDKVETFCHAGAYVTGLELIYPLKELQYTTGQDNATYDLKVTLSSNGEILHLGNNMSFNEIGNVIKILDNKLNLNSFGYDIFEIRRSLDIKR